jgi:hypothetical protein
MAKAKGAVLDPEAVARKVAAMALGRVAAHRERVAQQAQLLTRLAEMDLDELRRHSTTRQWLCAAAECSGATGPEIARIVGLKGGEVSAHRLKKHPVVRRLVELIRRHQLELVLRGQYGTTAQARAAAPEVLIHLSELAGAERDHATGERRGRATRDRDAIAAGQVVLDVAGVRVQRHQHQHIHTVLFEQMSDEELERYAADGTWPTRFEGALGASQDFTDPAALPAPTVNGLPAQTEVCPPTGRRGGRG